MANIELIKKVISEREEEIKNKFNSNLFIERDIKEIIKKSITKDAAVIITGVRRCGKSTLSLMIEQNEKFAYINFEDERLNMKSEELNDVLEAIYSLKKDVDVLIFDEIQNIYGWEKFISRLISVKKIIITGSNSNLLSKELSTFLTGRHVDFVLMPFSFKEFLRIEKFNPNPYLTKDIAQIKNLLEKYIEKGGLPLSYTLGKLFLLETYKDIIEKDIIQRYSIKNKQTIKELSKIFLSNYSREITYNSLKKTLNLKSSHTVKKYATYLENTYLFFIIDRFSYKLKEQILAPKKVYSIDTGMIKAVSSEMSENKGRIIENLVAIELLRRKNAEMLEFYYYKDHQQREVDFLIKKGNKVMQLIQVCYDINDLNNEREIKSLLNASKELQCKKLLVITWDYEAEKEGIIYIPLWKWLLNS